MRQPCVCCCAPGYRGFLCGECWDALAGLREMWAADGVSYGPPNPEREAKVREYRAKVAAGVPLFEGTAGCRT